MIINKIFPILDPNKCRLRVTTPLADGSNKDSLEMDFTTSIFCTLGGTELIGSQLTASDIGREYVVINQKLNSVHDLDKDFPQISCHKHISEVMPLLPNAKKSIGFPTGNDVQSKLENVPIEKSAVYTNFAINKAKFESEGTSGFVQNAINFQKKQGLVIHEAQKSGQAIRDKQKPKYTEAEEMELRIMKEMSKRSPEEARNTRIRFFKDDKGTLSYSLVQLSELSAKEQVVGQQPKPAATPKSQATKAAKQKQAPTEPKQPEEPQNITAPVLSKKQKK
jgi:hypothetical protein